MSRLPTTSSGCLIVGDPSTDPLAAVYEFCFGDGRAVPPSIFLGRVVPKGAPEWLPEDREAALEWQAYQRSLCPGCKRPRHESFDIAMDDHYDVTPLRCNACYARDSKAWNRNAGRAPDEPPQFGEFYIVQPDGDAPIPQTA